MVKFRVEEREDLNGKTKYFPAVGYEGVKKTGWFWNRTYSYDGKFKWHYLREDDNEGYVMGRECKFIEAQELMHLCLSFDSLDEAKKAIEIYKQSMDAMQKEENKKKFKSVSKIIPID